MRFTHNTHDTSMLYFSVFLSKVMSFVCSVSQFTQEIALEEEKKTKKKRLVSIEKNQQRTD